MSTRRDWATLEALALSPKGQLRYSRDAGLEDILAASEDSCKISPYCAWVLNNIVTKQTEDIPLAIELSSPPKSHDKPETEFCKPSEDSLTETKSPVKLNSSRVEGTILLYESWRKMDTQDKLQQRVELMEQHSKAVANQAVEQLKRYDEMMELKLRQEQDQRREMLEKSYKEALGQQEKLKEQHRHRAKLLNLKLREAEQQRQQEQERLRQEEGRERMRKLCALQQEVLQLVQQMEPNYKQQGSLRLDLSAYSNRGNQLCSMLSNVVRSCSERGFPTQEDISVGDRAVQEMRALVSNMHRDVAAAEGKKRAEEDAAKEKQKAAEIEQQAKAQAPAPAPHQIQTRKQGLQKKAPKSLLQRYRQTLNKCDECLKSIDQLITSKDTQVKMMKTELQKAVTTPVAQISTIGGTRLRDIFDKLNNLLIGKEVSSRNRSISVKAHPQGLEFAYYKLAEKFVKQGEEEVAAHHESAFCIGVVVSGIWELHPRVGELFLAHLYKKCPYTLPYYPSYKEGTPLEDYQRELGYLVVNGNVEQQDVFLKRMSGMIRLYAATIQLRWPYGTGQGPHPHGLNHGWSWLAHMLNTEPLSDITPTLLFDFLEVCGNALLEQYQGQFWKLLQLLKDEYIQRIEMNVDSTQMGAVNRLREFLRVTFQHKEIPLPKGYLEPSFWRR
ncbi:mRNA export factor GLE1 [Bombina bombina]|uniref:mRNA export factor GLE1 n=1 Tax=Bombina bombina TaxID=8345 RepID=UPI00235AD312|nr:mRNA export factor GLE1 [Bombina bombina]